MTAQTAQPTLVPMNNPHFRKGYELGRGWYFCSFGEREGEPDDEYLIVNIQGYCEKGLHEDMEWLAERIGFLIGMISGNLLPE